MRALEFIRDHVTFKLPYENVSPIRTPQKIDDHSKIISPYYDAQKRVNIKKLTQPKVLISNVPDNVIKL